MFGGYKFNKHFALELAYTDLGEVSGSDVFPGFSDSFKAELKGFLVQAVGTWPIDKNFSVPVSLSAIEKLPKLPFALSVASESQAMNPIFPNTEKFF